MKVIDEAWVLLILESSLYLGVALPQEHDAFLLACLLVVSLDLRKFVSHFVSEILHVIFLDLSNSYFIEVVNCLVLCLCVNFLEFVLKEGSTGINLLFHVSNEHLI